MKQKRNFRKRFLATVTALFFGVTNTTWAQAPVPISLGQPANVEVFLPANFTIPDSLGSVQAGLSEPRPDKPVVIVIQDAHGVLDAQNNIQKIINYLQTKYGINVIALEGGKGRLDPTLFRTFPDEFVKKKIIEDYLKRGELTGSEMAAIFNKEEGIYHGIEDWDLYEENYLAYLRAMEKKDSVLKQLGAARENLDKERRQIYSPPLNEFHEQISAFEAENKYLLEVLKYLGTLEGTREHLSKYPEIEKLFRSFEFEEETSKKPEAVEMTVRKMAESLKAKYLPKMNIKQEMSFHKNYQAFVTGQMQPADFLKFLIEMGESFGVKARLTPSLLKVLGHSQTLATIKGTELFRELENLLREIEESLTTKPEERQLAEKFRQLNLLRDLASLELTRDQWEEYQKNPTLSLEGRGQGEGADLLKPALEFYRLALERDQAFRRNLAKLLKEQNTKSAIVLAGGFHTEGFERNLKEDGISYAVITPKIQSLAGQETYQSVMQGNISYKPYLRTTFYDAFVKDSTSKLANQWSEPDFRKNIKNWRDEVIRRLSKEGRVAQAKDYTRYIDLVLKVYYDKYGKIDDSPEARREILRAMDKELKAFRRDTVSRLWQEFQAQFGALQITQPRSATLIQLATVALEPEGPTLPAMRSELRQFIETSQLPETPEATPLMTVEDIVEELKVMAAGARVSSDTLERLAGTEAVRRVAGEIMKLGTTASTTLAPETNPVAVGTTVGREFIDQMVRNVARDVKTEAPDEADNIASPGAAELAIVNAVNTQQINLGNGINVTAGRAEVRSPGETVADRLTRLTRQPEARVPISISNTPFYKRIDVSSEIDETDKANVSPAKVKAAKEGKIREELAKRSPILEAIVGGIEIKPGLGPNELSFKFLDANRVSIPARNIAGEWIDSNFVIQTNPEGTEIIRLQASSPPGTASEVLRALVSYLKDLRYSSVPFVDLDKYPGSKAFLASTIGFWGADTNMPDSTYNLQLQQLTAGLNTPLISRLEALSFLSKEDPTQLEQISEAKEKEILTKAFISAKNQGLSNVRLARLKDPKNPEKNYLFFENLLNQWTPEGQPIAIDRSASFFDIDLNALTNLPTSWEGAAGSEGRSEVRQKWDGKGTTVIPVNEGSGTQAIQFNERTKLVVRVAGNDAFQLIQPRRGEFIIQPLNPNMRVNGNNIFRSGQVISGGRDRSSNVILGDPKASRFQFEIEILPGGRVLVSDLFSRNGAGIKIENPENLPSLIGTEVAIPPELTDSQIRELLRREETGEADRSIMESGSLGGLTSSLSKGSLDAKLLKRILNPGELSQADFAEIVETRKEKHITLQNNDEIKIIADAAPAVARLLRLVVILVDKLTVPKYERRPDGRRVNVNAYYYPEYFSRNRKGALSLITVIDGILKELEKRSEFGGFVEADDFAVVEAPREAAAPAPRFAELSVLGTESLELEPKAVRMFSYDNLPFKISISRTERIFDVADGQLRYYVAGEGRGVFQSLPVTIDKSNNRPVSKFEGEGIRVVLTGDTILVENTGRVSLTLTGGRKGVAEEFARSEVRVLSDVQRDLEEKYEERRQLKEYQDRNSLYESVAEAVTELFRDPEIPLWNEFRKGEARIIQRHKAREIVIYKRDRTFGENVYRQNWRDGQSNAVRDQWEGLRIIAFDENIDEILASGGVLKEFSVELTERLKDRRSQNARTVLVKRLEDVSSLNIDTRAGYWEEIYDFNVQLSDIEEEIGELQDQEREILDRLNLPAGRARSELRMEIPIENRIARAREEDEADLRRKLGWEKFQELENLRQQRSTLRSGQFQIEKEADRAGPEAPVVWSRNREEWQRLEAGIEKLTQKINEILAKARSEVRSEEPIENRIARAREEDEADLRRKLGWEKFQELENLRQQRSTLRSGQYQIEQEVDGAGPEAPVVWSRNREEWQRLEAGIEKLTQKINEILAKARSEVRVVSQADLGTRAESQLEKLVGYLPAPKLGVQYAAEGLTVSGLREEIAKLERQAGARIGAYDTTKYPDKSLQAYIDDAVKRKIPVTVVVQAALGLPESYAPTPKTIANDFRVTTPEEAIAANERLQGLVGSEAGSQVKSMVDGNELKGFMGTQTQPRQLIKLSAMGFSKEERVGLVIESPWGDTQTVRAGQEDAYIVREPKGDGTYQYYMVQMDANGDPENYIAARSELREKAQRDPGFQMRILNDLMRTLLPYSNQDSAQGTPPRATTNLYPALINALTRYLTGESLEDVQKIQQDGQKEAQKVAADESSSSNRFYRFAGSLKSLFFFWFHKKGATKNNPIQERLLKLTKEIQERLERKRKTAQGDLLSIDQSEWGAGAAVLLAFAALVGNQNPEWVVYEYSQIRSRTVRVTRTVDGKTEERDETLPFPLPPGERGDFTAALLTLSRFWGEEEPRDQSGRSRVLEEYQNALKLTEREVTERGRGTSYLRESATTVLPLGRADYQGIPSMTAAAVVLTKRLRDASDRLRALERNRVGDVSGVPVLRDDWNSDLRGTLTDVHRRWVSLSTQASSSFGKPSDSPYPMEYSFAAALVELGTVLSDYRSVQGFTARRADLEERQREAQEAEEREKGTAGAALAALRRRAAFLYAISRRLNALEIPNQVYRDIFQRLKANSPEGSPIYVNADYALKKLDRLDVLDPLPAQALALEGASLDSRTALRDEMQKNFWNILEGLPDVKADDVVRELERREFEGDIRVSRKQVTSPPQNFVEALEKLEARVDILSDALLRLQRLQLTEEELKAWFDQNDDLSAPEIEKNVRELEASRRTLSWDEANERAVRFIEQFRQILGNLPALYRAVNLPDAVTLRQNALNLFEQGLREFQTNKREVFTRAARQSGRRDRNAADTMYAITVEDLKEGAVKVAQNVVDRIWRDNILYQMKVGEYNKGTVSATEAAAARNSLIEQAMALQDVVTQTSAELEILLSTPSPAPETAAGAARVTWQNNPQMQQIRGAAPDAENAVENFNALVAQGVTAVPYLTQVLSDESLRKDATEGTGAVSEQAQAVRQTAVSVLERIEQGFSRTDAGDLSRMAVVRALMPLHRDPQLQIRNAAMTLLERLGVEASETPVGQRLRMSVVTTLSGLYLKSSYPETRRDTIAALGDIANPSDTVAAEGNATVVDLLMPHLNDPAEQVQSAAVLSLGELLSIPAATDLSSVSNREKAVRSLSNLISNSTSAGEAFEAAVETLGQLGAPAEVVVGALTNLLQRIDPEDVAFNERVVDLLTRVAEANKDNPAVTGSLEILLTKRNSPSNARFGIFQVLDQLGRGETAIDELEASYQAVYDNYLSGGLRVERTRLELNTTRQSLVETLGRIAGDRIATSQRRDNIANFLIGVLTPYQGTLRPQGEIEDADVMVGAVEALGKIPTSALSYETYNNIVPPNGVLQMLNDRFYPQGQTADMPLAAAADKVVTAIENTMRKFITQTPPAPGAAVSLLPTASPPADPAEPGSVQPSVQPPSVSADDDFVSGGGVVPGAPEARSELRKVSVASALENPLNLTGLSPEAVAQLAATNPQGIAGLGSNAWANLLGIDRQLGIGSRKFLVLFRGMSANEIILTIVERGALTRIDQSLGLGNVLAVVDAADRLGGAALVTLAQLAGIVSIPTAGAFEALPADFQPMTPQALFLLSRPDLLQKVLAKYPDVKLNERGAKVFDGRLIAPPQMVEEYQKDIAYLEQEVNAGDIAVIDPQIKGINEALRRFALIRRLVLKNNSLDEKKLGIGFEKYVMILHLETKLKAGRTAGLDREGLYYDPSVSYLREANLYLSGLGVLSALALSNDSVKVLMQPLESGIYRMTPNAFSALTSIVNRLALDEDVQQAYEAAA